MFISKRGPDDTAFYRTISLGSCVPDLYSEHFSAFFVERSDDHVGFLRPDASNIPQPRLHPSLVAVQYLQHNCA